MILAVVHGDRGHFGVAHAGLDRGEGGLHRAVLHDGGAADSSSSSALLITLTRSTSSLASTYLALGNFFMMKSPIANDIW